MTAAPLGQARSGRIPDILDVIAQLSSDEVPTPPVLARALLDLLPADVWSNPDYKWLNPASKSGAILREVTRRLMDGLEGWQPDPQKRAEHILTNMIYGCAITQLTGEMTRRSVYVSRDASSTFSVVRFPDREQGHLPFVEAQHDYPAGKDGHAKGHCRRCGAPPELERGASRENYAYAFIHGAYPTEEMKDMQFDVVVGNPPYQMGAEGTTRTMPIYQLFVEQAIALEPRYVAMITPSRWFAGGLGLDEYRDKMIADRRLRALVDNPKLFDCFPGVEIKGGVSYFLWDREYNGDCEFSTRIDGQIISTSIRDIRDGDGVLIRDNRGAEIVALVQKQADSFVSSQVKPRLAFSERFRTNFRGSVPESTDGAIPIVYNGGVGYVAPDEIERNKDLLEAWKVLVPKAGDGHGREVSYVLGDPIALAPGSVCTESYFVAGAFATRDETENYAKYLATKFARFLLLQRKVTQDLTPDRFRFVPMLDMTREWSDADLFDHFKLSAEQRAYIEATIHPREPIYSLDSPVPATHLPGGAKYRAGGVPDPDPEDVE